MCVNKSLHRNLPQLRLSTTIMVKLVISSSQFQAQVSDLLPCNKGKRSQLIHGLLNCYSLFDKFDHVISRPYSDKRDLLRFHAESYLDAVLNPHYDQILPYDENESPWLQLIEMATDWSHRHDSEVLTHYPTRAQLYEHFQGLKWKKRSMLDLEEDEDTAKIDLEVFNLQGDCPIFSYLPMYCQVITGATLMLADYVEAVSQDQRTVAINWDGGRHHAMKKRASGFCYVNDIVLLIQKLRGKGFHKLTYVDFDLHHGDGVEKAFQFSSNVQTISMHLFECGFFPTTGSLEDSEEGKNVVDIPLAHGLDDEYLNQLTMQIVIPLIDLHSPQVLVIQCGGDGLMGDEYHEWQLTIRGLCENILKLVNQYHKCSIILLGGGGYNPTIMSRFYTYLTGKLTDPNFLQDEDSMIPEHEYVDAYHDEHYKFWAYEMENSLLRKTLKNDNKTELINKIKDHYRI